MNFFKGHMSFPVQRFVTSQREQGSVSGVLSCIFITPVASETTKEEDI